MGGAGAALDLADLIVYASVSGAYFANWRIGALHSGEGWLNLGAEHFKGGGDPPRFMGERP